MEEKSHSPVVVDINLPASLPTPHSDEAAEAQNYLRNSFKDLYRGGADGQITITTTTTPTSRMAANLVSGVAFSLVSYRVYKTRSLKTVFQSKSVAKDMTYLGVLYGAAELSQQSLKMSFIQDDSSNAHDEKQPAYRRSIDLSSVKNVALFGSSLAAPLFHYWYRFLDARFVGTAPLTLVKKVALDQLFASGSVSALFLVAIPAFQGESDLWGPESLFQRKFLSIYLTGCAFWPLAQTINFRFVSPRYRVAYLGFAAFLWTNILCFSRH